MQYREVVCHGSSGLEIGRHNRRPASVLGQHGCGADDARQISTGPPTFRILPVHPTRFGSTERFSRFSRTRYPAWLGLTCCVTESYSLVDHEVDYRSEQLGKIRIGSTAFGRSRDHPARCGPIRRFTRAGEAQNFAQPGAVWRLVRYEFLPTHLVGHWSAAIGLELPPIAKSHPTGLGIVVSGSMLCGAVRTCDGTEFPGRGVGCRGFRRRAPAGSGGRPGGTQGSR